MRILRRVATSVFSSEGSGGDLYGLDHGILNLQVPPVSMWMNMGFWEVRQPCYIGHGILISL